MGAGEQPCGLAVSAPPRSISSRVLSGISSRVLSGISSRVLSGVSSRVLTGVSSRVLTGVSSRVLTGAPSPNGGPRGMGAEAGSPSPLSAHCCQIRPPPQGRLKLSDLIPTRTPHSHWDDRPIWKVLPHCCINGKFVRQFEEEPDVFAFVQLLGKFIFDTGIVNNPFMG